MSKQFWGVIVLIVAVFIGIFMLTGSKSDAPGGKSSTKTLTNHVIGKGLTKVTLVEYGDYQCPFCGQYYPILKQVQAQYNDQIFFQFRNYPLTNPHPNAFAAARAAEAAALQNKFWEMHDILYETQSQWSQLSDAIPAFDQLAKQVGLDMAKYKADFASSKVNDLINADMAEGNRLGISGTPTFYLDGKKIEVTQSVDAFKKVIDAAIAKMPQPATSGTTSQTQGTTPDATTGGQ